MHASPASVHGMRHNSLGAATNFVSICSCVCPFFRENWQQGVLIFSRRFRPSNTTFVPWLSAHCMHLNFTCFLFPSSSGQWQSEKALEEQGRFREATGARADEDDIDESLGDAERAGSNSYPPYHRRRLQEYQWCVVEFFASLYSSTPELVVIFVAHSLDAISQTCVSGTLKCDFGVSSARQGTGRRGWPCVLDLSWCFHGWGGLPHAAMLACVPHNMHRPMARRQWRVSALQTASTGNCRPSGAASS